jgi:DNA-binding CsgD family transcriptional regulator
MIQLVYRGGVMSNRDLLLQTIEAIYASGIESEHLSTALKATSQLVGGVGAFFAAGKIPEFTNIAAEQPSEFLSFGTPEFGSAQYAEQVVTLNPRVSFSHKRGQLIWDYQFIAEDKMAHHPFYAEFLSSLGLRYFLAAVLERTPDKLATVSVQRTPEQGHVDEHEIEIMRCLFPHFQRAYDMTKRLKAASIRHGALENTLDWLNDGVALLRRDGRLIYVNEALCQFERRGDAFRIANDVVEFFSPSTQARFMAAFEAVIPVYGDLACNPQPMEFPAPRSDESPAYMVALRPIIHEKVYSLQHADTAVMMFIHDPLVRNATARKVLSELFHLTGAEINLAQALCAGMTTVAYASTRRVSLNTVYTHLRRIREKTQCNSVAELVRKFSELNVPLRLGPALSKVNHLPGPTSQLGNPVSDESVL